VKLWDVSALQEIANLLGHASVVDGVVVSWVAPANVEFRKAMLESLPANWMRLREQWEYGPAAQFVLHLAALGALVVSVVSETPAEVRPAKPAYAAARCRRSLATPDAG
jgi:hypothetical protein